MKKRLFTLVALLAMALCVGCSTDANDSVSNESVFASSLGDSDTQIRSVYDLYVAAQNEKGVPPITFEEWLAIISGGKEGLCEKGDPGKDGTSLLTGYGSPSSELGTEDDSYIDLSSWDFYRKTHAGWTKEGNLEGATGSKGDKGDKGDKGEAGSDGDTPRVGENGNWWVGDTDTGIPAAGAQGPKGDAGEEGESAYEIYIRYHPEYTGTEQEWIEDLVNGNLREKYTVTFRSNGGTPIDAQKVSYGHFVTKPEDPTRQGYLFTGWYYNGSPFPFNTFQVFDNITIYATWATNNIVVSLDANGGEVEYNTKTITYGVDYVLPVPSKNHATFEGWYFEETQLCPLSGTWDFSTTNITLVARWSTTRAIVNLETDEIVSTPTTSYEVEYGSYFSLPVPAISTGDSFVGWATVDGTLITDSDGDFIKKSAFTSEVTLHAIYNICIRTVNEWLALCSYSAGSPELKRTYLLENDLDFTGLSNGSVGNFEGILDGGGHRIIGMSKPMFSSIGRSDTSKITIKDLTFINLSASSIVETAKAAASITIDNVDVYSFKKDLNDYCGYYGLIQTVDGAFGKTALTITNCSVQDEFATIETGFVDYLKVFKTADLSNCHIRSNTKRSAFIAGDGFNSSTFFEPLDATTADSYGTSIKLSYCSNYGDTKTLISASCGSYCIYDHYVNAKRITDDSKIGKHSVTLFDIINFGDISDSSFVNCCSYAESEKHKDDLKSGIYEDKAIGSHKRIYGPFIRARLIAYGNFKISRFLNFGSLGKMVATTCGQYPKKSEWSTLYTDVIGYLSKDAQYSGNALFSLDHCFNAGPLEIATLNQAGSISFCYNYIPKTGLSDSCLEISSAAQINADFFVNTIGLDPDRWDLSYINVEDEYGLPQIYY